MSQGDYLKRKKISYKLKSFDDSKPVLDANDYTEYKEYALQNSITNTNTIFRRLVDSNNKMIFDIEYKTNSCPSFAICNDTNNRSNRVPLLGVYFENISNLKYTKHPTWEKTGCKCIPNRSYSNACKCKTLH
jgi:hypothetical protein